MEMEKPELLIPAGNLEKLRTALLYGADAVYVGVEGLSLRASSSEMSMADLTAGVNEAHRKSVKVYAAINTFSRNADLDKARKILPFEVDSEDIVLGNGSCQIINELFKIYEREKKLVIVPTFGEYVKDTYNSIYFSTEEDNFALNIDKLIDIGKKEKVNLNWKRLCHSNLKLNLRNFGSIKLIFRQRIAC